MQLREFRASDRATHHDQQLLEQYQVPFFPAALPKAKGRKRQRVEKCPWAVTGQRNSAYLHIKALDNQLQVSIGSGLIAFKGEDGDEEQVAIAYLNDNKIPPVLTIHLD